MDSDNGFSCKNVKTCTNCHVEENKEYAKNCFPSDFSSPILNFGRSQNKGYTSLIHDNFIFQNYKIIEKYCKIIKG